MIRMKTRMLFMGADFIRKPLTLIIISIRKRLIMIY
jgi:hypothetical protein